MDLFKFSFCYLNRLVVLDVNAPRSAIEDMESDDDDDENESIFAMDDCKKSI